MGEMPELQAFEHWPDDLVCPVCGTSADVQCVLVPIDGTGDGKICEAQPVHLACCMPTNYSPEMGLFYRRSTLVKPHGQ